MLSGLDLSGLASETVEIEGYLGCKKKRLRKNKEKYKMFEDKWHGPCTL